MALSLNDVATIVGVVLASGSLALAAWTHFVDYKQKYVPKVKVAAGTGYISPMMPGTRIRPVLQITAVNIRAAPTKLSGFSVEARGWTKRLFLARPIAPIQELPAKIEQGDTVEWPFDLMEVYDGLEDEGLKFPIQVRVRAADKSGNEFLSKWFELPIKSAWANQDSEEQEGT